MNIIFQHSKTDIIPEIGMGSTLIMFSDRVPFTIVEIVNEKTIVVQEDESIRTDSNGMSESQEYRFIPRPTSRKRTFTKRKDGRWIEKGNAMKSGSNLLIGERDKYYDYSF